MPVSLQSLLKIGAEDGTAYLIETAARAGAGRVEAIEQCLRRHPGLALVGGAYRGVGISDCVRFGEEAALRLIDAAAPAEDYESSGS